MMLQKTTTAACQNRLPQPLIDYLWRLADESGADAHTFILSAKYTGAGDVQEILHRRGNISSWRRVFGYLPVEAAVRVEVTGHSAVMSLLEEQPAPAGREGALACSA